MDKPQTRKFDVFNVYLFLFSFSVQDFLEKAKKEFEGKWEQNPKVSAGLWRGRVSLCDILRVFTLTLVILNI